MIDLKDGAQREAFVHLVAEGVRVGMALAKIDDEMRGRDSRQATLSPEQPRHSIYREISEAQYEEMARTRGIVMSPMAIRAMTQAINTHFVPRTMRRLTPGDVGVMMNDKVVVEQETLNVFCRRINNYIFGDDK